MKKLAIFRRVATLLFLMLTSVTLWGQDPELDPIDLNYCAIVDVMDNYTGNGEEAINFSFGLEYEDHVVSTEYYTATIKNSSDVTVLSNAIILEDEYTLTIVGDGMHCDGEIEKVFHVWCSGLGGGAGTEVSPYEIGISADWEKFARWINAGYNADKYYKLTKNITVSDMVGVCDIYYPENNKPFSGTFDGDGNTLTFNKGTSVEPFNDFCCAPFRCTDGANIRNLTVDGTIYTNAGMMAGLIAVNTRTSGKNTEVNTVIVGVNLNCNEEWWDSEGGGFGGYW